MAAKEKSQDEKNLKILRELASLATNKYCFDCQQRGPTYVNVTIGSFVCTTCSGILRGLHPPHRMKSITMTSFTADEMEQIKFKGNEYCKQVWLGKYEPMGTIGSEYQNAATIKEFMVHKYEDKKYYVEPEFAVKKPKPRAPSIPSGTTVTQSKSQIVIRTNTSSQLMQKPGWTSQTFSSGQSSTDIFKGFANESPQRVANQEGENVESGSFADFGSAFNSESNAFPQVASAGQSGDFPDAATPVADQTAMTRSSQKKPAPPPPDRYAALADLDNQLHQQHVVVVPVETAPAAQLLWATGPPNMAAIPFGNALPNPFSHAVPTWSLQNQASSVNPFQGVITQLPNQLIGPTMVPYTLSNGGAVEHGMRPNGVVTNSYWPTASGPLAPAQFPGGQVEAFPNKYSIPLEPYNPWAQSLASESANPFASNAGMPTSMPQKSSTNNPFL